MTTNAKFLICFFPIQIFLYYYLCFKGEEEINISGISILSFFIRLFFKDIILVKWINYKCYFSISSYCYAEGFSNLIYLYVIILNNLINEKKCKKISAIIAIFLNLLNNVISYLYYNRLEKIMEKYSDKDKELKNSNCFKYCITSIIQLILNILNAILVCVSFTIPIAYYAHKSYFRLISFIILDIIARIFTCITQISWNIIGWYFLNFLIIYLGPFSIFTLISFPFYGYFSKIVYSRGNADNFPLFFILLLSSPI